MNNITVALGLMAFSFASLATESAQAACGQLEVSKGDVKIESGATKKAAPAAAGAKICSGDTIIAGPDSRAKIKMEDGNELNISPDSKIVLENYQFAPAENKKKVLLNVLQGKVRAATKVDNMYGDKAKDGSDNSFQVKTKSAVAGVRGTDFLTGYNPQTNKAEVVTFKGRVEVGQPGPGGTISNGVQVNAGQKTEALPGQPPSTPRAIPPKELQQMNSSTKADTAGGPSSPGDKTASDNKGNGDKNGDGGDKNADKGNGDKNADKGGDKNASGDNKNADKGGDNKNADKGNGDNKGSDNKNADKGSGDNKGSDRKNADNQGGGEGRNGDNKGGDNKSPNGEAKGDAKQAGGDKPAGGGDGKQAPANNSGGNSAGNSSGTSPSGTPPPSSDSAGNAGPGSPSGGATGGNTAGSTGGPSGGSTTAGGAAPPSGGTAPAGAPLAGPGGPAPTGGTMAPTGDMARAPSSLPPMTGGSMISAGDLGGGIGFATTPNMPAAPPAPVMPPTAILTPITPIAPLPTIPVCQQCIDATRPVGPTHLTVIIHNP